MDKLCISHKVNTIIAIDSVARIYSDKQVGMNQFIHEYTFTNFTKWLNWIPPTNWQKKGKTYCGGINMIGKMERKIAIYIRLIKSEKVRLYITIRKWLTMDIFLAISLMTNYFNTEYSQWISQTINQKELNSPLRGKNCCKILQMVYELKSTTCSSNMRCFYIEILFNCRDICENVIRSI